MKSSLTIQTDIDRLVNQNKLLIYIGRFCPIHAGHQGIIGFLRHYAKNNHLILIGSCNNPISYRHLFSYETRALFIREIYGDEIKIAPLPDFESDEVWMSAIHDIAALKGFSPKNLVFVGGCEEDISTISELGYETYIINRFSGTTINISGTEIRDSLITGDREKLSKVISPIILPKLMKEFNYQWAKLKRL